MSGEIRNWTENISVSIMSWVLLVKKEPGKVVIIAIIIPTKKGKESVTQVTQICGSTDYLSHLKGWKISWPGGPGGPFQHCKTIYSQLEVSSLVFLCDTVTQWECGQHCRLSVTVSSGATWLSLGETVITQQFDLFDIFFHSRNSTFRFRNIKVKCNFQYFSVWLQSATHWFEC